MRVGRAGVLVAAAFVVGMWVSPLGVGRFWLCATRIGYTLPLLRRKMREAYS